MRRLYYLQHIGFEGPGALRNWWSSRGFEVQRIECWRADVEYPDPADVDVLVVLGGPMGVYDEDTCPWLTQEKDFIRDYLALQKPVLGICLGAQLLADALGALVLPNSEPEIGYWPVWDSAGKSGSLLEGLPHGTQVLHWHGDTFDLPEGAQLLLHSEACAHQAFQWGEHVLGLQFHLEAEEQWVQNVLDHTRDEIPVGKYVQNEDELLAGTAKSAQLHKILFGLLDRWLGTKE